MWSLENLEFKFAGGSGEARRTCTSENGTKSGLKLPKMLKDMLMQLAKEVSWAVLVLQTLTTIGFIHTGE